MKIAGALTPLPLFFGLDGVLYSMPVSDLPTADISGSFIVMTCRQLTKQSGN